MIAQIRKLSVVLVLLTLTGCASSGAFLASNTTEVQLQESNYDVVATNVVGQASAGYIFGVSTGYFGQMTTVAIARVDGEGFLYEEAIRDLWANFSEGYPGPATASLALVNVSYDTEALNLLFYTKPTVRVRADVVRFVD